MSYWDRAGQSTLTRQQIVTATASANAEVTAADLQTRAASAEQQAFSDAVDLAAQRAANARANAAEYATKSDLAVSYQASSSQISGGDDGDPNELNRLADTKLKDIDKLQKEAQDDKANAQRRQPQSEVAPAQQQQQPQRPKRDQ